MLRAASTRPLGDLLFFALLFFAGVGQWSSFAAAQNETLPKKAAKPEAAESDPAKAFSALVAKREALGKKLEKLQKDFAAADEAGKTKIRAEFEQTVKDFQQNTLPKMFSLGLQLYLEDAKNHEAEEVVLGQLNQLFTENKYKEAADMADKLLAAGRKHPLILNVGGVSHFAIQDFAKAQEILEAAKEAAGPIFEQLGGRYLEVCPKYIGFWKKEKEIRAREAEAPDDEKLPRVLLKTTAGNIELELFENQAPNTVANFVSLVEKKKYDGTVFHRVIPNFMVQGGDPNTLDNNPRNDGQGGPGYHIECECYRKDTRMHFQGSLSMAHAGKDTGGSQFFLTHLPTDHLNGKHTVFGRIVKGMEVGAAIQQGDKIVSATVLSKRAHPYVPKVVSE